MDNNHSLDCHNNSGFRCLSSDQDVDARNNDLFENIQDFNESRIPSDCIIELNLPWTREQCLSQSSEVSKLFGLPSQPEYVNSSQLPYSKL